VCCPWACIEGPESFRRVSGGARFVTCAVRANVIGSWDVRGESAPSDGRGARVAHRAGDDTAGHPGRRHDLRRLPGPPARRALAAARRIGTTGPLRGGHLDQLRRQRRDAQSAGAARTTRRGAALSSARRAAFALTAGRDPRRARLCPAPPGAGHQLRLRTGPAPGARTDERRLRHVSGPSEGSSAPARVTVTATATATPAATQPDPAAAAAAPAPHPSCPDPGGSLRPTSSGR
jgi:hypothetical protein